MLPLLVILSSILLLAGFVLLTRYETTQGVRYFAEERGALDQFIARVSFILEHVDLAAFLRDEIRHQAHRIGHDVTHLTLQSVRAVERLLTRLVRSFRMREENAPPRETAREFVKTLSDFKEHLKANTPEVLPEIQ